MRIAPLLLALAPLVLTACAAERVLVAPRSTEWRTDATEEDRDRLRDWRQTFIDAVADARKGGFGSAIDAEGTLLTPDSAIGGALPPGPYRCRTIKLGARYEGNRHYVAYPAIPCAVTQVGAARWFAIPGGVQRPAGFIYPGDRLHDVFLGALSLGDEKASMRYGTDSDRNMIGWVDRLGPARWRIVLPAPHFESRTDVIELVPAGG